MGILHSIIRFLCCSTTEREDDEESEIRPLLSYPAHEDSSTFYAKGLLQKLPQPRKAAADSILPIRNPAPITFANSTSEIRANTCSHVGVFKTQDRPQQLRHWEEVYDVSSLQWPPKTNSKIMIQNVVPAVKESKKIVEKEKEKKREQKDEAIIVKRSTVVVAAVVDEGKWIKHYSSRHRILVVGDGDFSFSASLGVAFGRASNMISTSLNSIDFLKKNYGNAPSNIEKLRSRGCKVMHGIDATEIANHALLGHLKFDRIVYNFPFAGFFPNLPQGSQLRRHRTLVSLFLKNAKEMISENGEIHISHKTNGFHAEWKLQSIASSNRLRLIEAVDFNLLDYPGYNTKYGFGGDGNFNCYPSNTFKFGLKY